MLLRVCSFCLLLEFAPLPVMLFTGPGSIEFEATVDYLRD